MVFVLQTYLFLLTLPVLELLGGLWLTMCVVDPFPTTFQLLSTLCAPCLTTLCWSPICHARVATLRSRGSLLSLPLQMSPLSLLALVSLKIIGFGRPGLLEVFMILRKVLMNVGLTILLNLPSLTSFLLLLVMMHHLLMRLFPTWSPSS